MSSENTNPWQKYTLLLSEITEQPASAWNGSETNTARLCVMPSIVVISGSTTKIALTGWQ